MVVRTFFPTAKYHVCMPVRRHTCQPNTYTVHELVIVLCMMSALLVIISKRPDAMFCTRHTNASAIILAAMQVKSSAHTKC